MTSLIISKIRGRSKDKSFRNKPSDDEWRLPIEASRLPQTLQIHILTTCPIEQKEGSLMRATCLDDEHCFGRCSWRSGTLGRTKDSLRHILIPQHLHGRPPACLQPERKGFRRLLKKWLARISFKRGHAALEGCGGEAFDSTTALVVVVAVEHTLAAIVQHTKGRLHEIVVVLLVASPKASGAFLDALTFNSVGENMPDVLRAILQWFSPAAQRTLAMRIAQTFPNRREVCLRRARKQVLRILVKKNLGQLQRTLRFHAQKLCHRIYWRW